MRNALQASPEELVVYHQVHWVPRHGETLLATGVFPAPNSLEGNFSLLSGMFEVAGRTGPYSAELGIGNPVQSRPVRDYKEGYARWATSVGYATTSAQHLTKEKLVALVGETTKKQAAMRATLDWGNRTAVVQHLETDRDLVAVCGAWECCLRGHDIGLLMKQSVQDRQGHSLFPWLTQRSSVIQAGLQYQIATCGTKTVQRRRAGVVALEAKAEEEAELCFLRRLQQFMRDCQDAGLEDSCYLIRPEWPNHRGFKGAGMTSGVLNKRFQRLLMQAGLYEGETLHGIRRGTMQDAVGQGKSVAEVGAHALQKTMAVTEMYLDTSRETYGPVKLKGLRRNAPY